MQNAPHGKRETEAAQRDAGQRPRIRERAFGSRPAGEPISAPISPRVVGIEMQERRRHRDGHAEKIVGSILEVGSCFTQGRLKSHEMVFRILAVVRGRELAWNALLPPDHLASFFRVHLEEVVPI